MIIQHLANLPSSCPSDSSSFESCVSALKSSISALESSIRTKDGSSGFWETFGWLCAIVVGIGILGELVVIFSEYRDDLEDWQRGIIRPPDRPPAWRFRFDIVATILVLGGVFGEAGATGMVASINSHLRSKTSELRAKSDQLLSVITEEAGDAATSAKAASDALIPLRAKAAVLDMQLDTVKRETHTAEGKITSVSQKADESEERLKLALAMLSPREVLKPEIMRAGLKEFIPGQKEYKHGSPPIVIKSYTGDLEAFRTCVELGNVISVLPDVTLGCGQEPLPSGPIELAVDGIQLHFGSQISFLQLRLLSLLRQDGGLGVIGDIGDHGDPEYNDKPLEIMIGLKSPFSQARMKWLETLNQSTQLPKSKRK